MSLTPGTRLGSYDISAQIGAGGMGEVYRATDSNLKRAVAIKILPASVAGDADRLARFQREAEVLALSIIRTSPRSTDSRRPRTPPLW
jgi:serine/threonine protein kinase